MRRNKFNAKKTWYEHRLYDSKAEAARAQMLNVLVCCDEIDRWMPQPRFFLGKAQIEYRPDFLVLAGNSFWVEDVKGVETPKFKMIKDLWAAYGPYPLHVMRLIGNRWELEIIPGGGQK